MKLKKILAMILSCLLIVSLFAACGGEEEYEDEEVLETEAVEEYEDEELSEEEAPVEGLASEETWNTLMENATVFGKYNAVLKQMSPEEADPELIAYIDEINPRVMEVAAYTRDNTTEEMALAANDDILSWIDNLAQYIEIEE